GLIGCYGLTYYSLQRRKVKRRGSPAGQQDALTFPRWRGWREAPGWTTGKRQTASGKRQTYPPLGWSRRDRGWTTGKRQAANVYPAGGGGAKRRGWTKPSTLMRQILLQHYRRSNLIHE